MDQSTNYYFNYTHGSTPWPPVTPLPSYPMMGYVQSTLPSVPQSEVHVPILIHRKIHINPSVLLPQHHRENYPSPQPISSQSMSPRTESRPSVKKHRNKRSRNSRKFRRYKCVTDRRNIDNNGSKISSRELARLILKTRAEEHRPQRNDDNNDDDDIDELMNRELTNREKFKRTVDARLWLQAKTAMDAAKQITEARDQECKNHKAIRLETHNRTFVNRGTSPIVFESTCKGESVDKYNINSKTEVELLESGEDDYQIIEIDSKTEDELLRDDDEDK